LMFIREHEIYGQSWSRFVAFRTVAASAIALDAETQQPQQAEQPRPPSMSQPQPVEQDYPWQQREQLRNTSYENISEKDSYFSEEKTWGAETHPEWNLDSEETWDSTKEKRWA